jgi:uncharacterized protein
MLQDLASALRLQALDRKISSLENEIAVLPGQIAAIEKKLEQHGRRLEADRAALAANLRDRKKFEGDIQIHQAKISKLRDQMLLAKTNEQYRAFQNEISYAEGEIRKAEDQILDLMEASERLEANVKTADVELQKQKTHVEAEKSKARERTAVSQKQLDEARTERTALSAKIPAALLTQYDRIRKKTKGLVFAEAVGGRCEACQITIRPQLLQDLRKGDQIITCESCGRILIDNPVVDAAADISASQQIA